MSEEKPKKNTRTEEDKRTTISLAHVVWDMAEEMMRDKGFNGNFSAYVADLVRRDKERKEQIELRRMEAQMRRPYPGTHAQAGESISLMEEEKAPWKKSPANSPEPDPEVALLEESDQPDMSPKQKPSPAPGAEKTPRSRSTANGPHGPKA